MFTLRLTPIRRAALSLRRLWRKRQLIDPTVVENLEDLGAQSTSLTSRISSLEKLIVTAPGKAQEVRLRMLNTIPAPEEFLEEPELPLRREQVRALRTRRHKDLAGFVFLLCGLAAVLLWLCYQLTYYSLLP